MKGERHMADKNFLTDIIDADLAEGKIREIHTRFPPEPNGYLHIGSAKAIYINWSIANQYGGKFNLRLDDTNPAREGEEYVNSIIEDLHWLGADPNGGIFYGSDYFDKCYEYAEKLIQEGKAYVDDLTRDEMREYRGADAGKPSRPSPYRDRTPEENLDLFRRMRAGEFKEGEKTLRAKIDLASPNMNMRDPAIYRIKYAEHHRQGSKWCIYPMYDFAHPIQDAIEGITHSMCSLEFENHRPLYNWVIENIFGTEFPKQREFARLNMTKPGRMTPMMFELNLIERAKANKMRIVLAEGEEPRILQATDILLRREVADIILLGNADKINKLARELHLDISKATIIDPVTSPKFEDYAATYAELRKAKGVTIERARDVMSDATYYATMMVKKDDADGMVSGAIHSTADTLRPALQIIKTKPGSKIVSSCFIMVRPSATGENEVLAMADCAINIKPTEDELVEICRETVECAKIFGVDPKVAFLSYSTLGSGKGEDVDKMRNACEKAKAEMPNTPIGGEFQFDAAVSPVVAKTKHISDSVGGHANTFIFPDINAGNIGYKIAQRLGNFDAYGPILLGLNAPINDLSRGCNAQEVYSMAIITAALA